MINENDFESKQFVDALGQMRELELARLLDMVESLTQDFRQNPLLDGESAMAVAAAQEFLNIWNDEVKRILTMRRVNDIAQSRR